MQLPTLFRQFSEIAVNEYDTISGVSYKNCVSMFSFCSYSCSKHFMLIVESGSLFEFSSPGADPGVVRVVRSNPLK